MKRLWVIGLIVIVLVVAGMSGRSGAALALALPFAIYVGAAVLGSQPNRPQLEITRTLDSNNVHSQTPVKVHVQIRNNGPALEEALIENPIPDNIEVIEGSPRLLTQLQNGQSVEIEFTIRSWRGSFNLQDLSLTGADHFNLFLEQWPLHTTTRLNVFPEILALDSLPLFPRQTRGFAGPIPSRQGGSGTDFHDVREYQLGDPLRRINWRISARHSAAFQQEVFSNIYQLERIADIGVILDARMQSNVIVDEEEFTGSDSLFEYSSRAAASLCDRFLADGNRVSLMIFGYAIERVYPGYGRVQKERMLRAIARAETGHNYSLETFSHLPVRMFPPKSQLVIISPLLPADPQALARMLSSGYEIMVVSPNPIGFETRNLEDSPSLAQAARLAQVERRLVIKRLSRMGILFVDWRVDQPLQQAMNTALNSRIAARIRAGSRMRIGGR